MPRPHKYQTPQEAAAAHRQAKQNYYYRQGTSQLTVQPPSQPAPIPTQSSLVSSFIQWQSTITESSPTRVLAPESS